MHKRIGEAMEDIRRSVLDTGIEEVVLNRSHVSQATKQRDTGPEDKSLPEHRLRKEAYSIRIIDSTHDGFSKVVCHMSIITER